MSPVQRLKASLLQGLRGLVEGEIVILMGRAAGWARAAEFLRSAGAEAVLVGPCAAPKGESTTTAFETENTRLLNPEPETVAFLRRVDPECRARIYAGSAVSARSVDGRGVLGRRLSHWRDLEKKGCQISLTGGQSGYTPSYRCLGDGADLELLISDCASRIPCVISGDPKNAIGMGSNYVFRFDEDTGAETLRNVCAAMAHTCDGVRVGEFTVGVPATFYGFVRHGQIAVFQPAEALVGADAFSCRIVAPGILTPVSMRSSVLASAIQKVRSIVQAVVDQSGYRGAFGVDGVLQEQGYVVHEINTRVCAGFAMLARCLQCEIPMGLVDLVVRDGDETAAADLMMIVSEIAEMIPVNTDVMLWGDSAIEGLLTSQIGGLSTTAEKVAWQDEVRHLVLRDHIPLRSVAVASLIQGGGA